MKTPTRRFVKLTTGTELKTQFVTSMVRCAHVVNHHRFIGISHVVPMPSMMTSSA
ncbi:MAG: hypothetical protein JRN28_01825 [Nitrososphaerota archaeon]|nr:hypothetical protein [Nitrososphaerota archaeon]